MSFSSTTDRAQYTGNGSTKDFAVPFPFQADGDIAVVVTTSGVDSTKTLNVDYAVTGEGTEGGGNVRFTTAPASGVTVTIYRDIDLNQTRDFSYNGSFPTSTVTGAADKAMQAIQQLNAKLKRTFRISEASAEIAPLTVADRAGKVPAFDNNGNPTLIAPEITAFPYGAPYAISNIAALKAVLTSTVPTGTQVSVAGYYMSGDGGGGMFYYDSGSSATDNGGTIIAPNSGTGRWLRVYQGPIDLCWFGFATGNADNKSIFQTATSYAASVGANSFVGVRGTYFFSKSTAIPANTCLDLSGSTFKLLASQQSGGSYPLADAPFFTLGGNNIEIYGGTIDGNKSNQASLTNASFSDTWSGHTAQAAIRGDTAYDKLTIRNLTISNTSHSGICIKGAWTNVAIRDNRLTDIFDVAIYQGEDGTSGATDLLISGNTITRCGTQLAGPSITTQRGWANAIITTFSINSKIIDNTVSECYDRDCIKLQIPNNAIVSGNVLIDGSTGIQSQSSNQPVKGVVVSGNTIRNMRFCGIYVEASSTPEESIVISGNAITNTGSTDPSSVNTSVPRGAIYCGLVRGAQITGNTINTITYATIGGVTVVSSEDVTVANNTIISASAQGILLSHSNNRIIVESNSIYRCGDHGIQVGNTITALGGNNYHVIKGNRIYYPGFGSGGTKYGLFCPLSSSTAEASFNYYEGNLTIGRGNYVDGDCYAAINNIGVGSFTSAYSGLKTRLSGNGYYDDYTSSANFIAVP